MAKESRDFARYQVQSDTLDSLEITKRFANVLNLDTVATHYYFALREREPIAW
jgi:hypothetical protein